MLKQNWRLISRLERVGDFVFIIVAFFAAYYGRASLLFWDARMGWDLPFAGEVLAPLKDYFAVLIVGLIAYLILLNFMGAYSSMRLTSRLKLFLSFLLSSVIVFLILGAVLYILKIDLSRSFIGIFCFMAALILFLERVVILEVLRYWRRKGFNYRNVVVCGSGKQALKVAEEIYKRPELGIRIRCFADLRSTHEIPQDETNNFRSSLKEQTDRNAGRIIFGVDGLSRALRKYVIDEVIFTDVIRVMPQVEEVMEVCSLQGVRTTLVADLFSRGILRSGVSYFGGMPLIHFQTPPGDRRDLMIKRALDIAVSGMLLIVLSPVFLIMALLIVLTSGFPVFFMQKRVGLNGHLFNLYKFRSMHRNAEEQLEKLREQNEMDGPAFKMKEDPRVTWIGKLLRRYSLDELPQLWNVLIGEMSLVGPRPPVPGEVRTYERKYRRRLSMRPGITCTWQVSGRSEITDFDNWVSLDLEYIDNWSLGNDLMLLLRTVPAVLSGKGAS